MKWFRFYEEVLNDPKVQSLPGDLFKFWVNLLCIASSCNGKLPLHVTISFHLRALQSEVECNIKKLLQFGLLEKKGDFLIPHNWARRQYLSDSSRDRVRKFRAKRCNVSVTLHRPLHDRYSNVTETVTVTPPDTDTETDSKAITKEQSLSCFDVSEEDLKTVVLKDIVAQKNPARPRAALKPSSEVFEIFDHWRSVMGHQRSQLTPQRVAIIQKAMRGGYSVADLCEAITGCSHSSFHMGDNERGMRYDTMELIFRNAGFIDKFIKCANQPPLPKKTPTTVMEKNEAVLSEILRKEKFRMDTEALQVKSLEDMNEQK